MNRPIVHPIRLGAVDYLNVRPLVHGLEARRDLEGNVQEPMFSLRFDAPSVCATLLRAGAIDLGTIPSIAYQHHESYRAVFDIAIASDGPVASVALFTRMPVSRIRTVAADTSSHTSVALLRVLCAERFQFAPDIRPAAPDLSAMLSEADAALLIGDPALFADHAALGVEKIDLGAEWTALTGLPFVWAFWAGPREAVDARAIARLQRAKREGLAASDALADAYAAAYSARTGVPVDAGLARRYLKENIKYDLGVREVAGLERFYGAAMRAGVIARVQPVRFFAP